MVKETVIADIFDVLSVDSASASGILNIGTTYQEVVTITTPDLPAGKYLFAYAYELGFNGQKNQPCISQVTGHFASQEYSDSIGDNDVGDLANSYGYPFTHAGGVITTGIQMRKSASFAAQLDVSYIDIVINRIGY